jgi:hypothetical protein
MTGNNRDKDWSPTDLADLQSCARLGIPLEGTSVLLGRDQMEVAKKAMELRLSFPLGNTAMTLSA